tara:strand:+ start:67 stop:222 length:156 start_codon:yes stop_codon:yes gene_type:complete
MRKFTHIAFDVAIKILIGGLGTLAITGITFMIYMLVTGQVEHANFNCGICY